MNRNATLWLNSWIYLLNVVAGFMNVATILSFGVPSTHFTGNLSQVVISTLEGNFILLSIVVGSILSFVIGGAVSGYMFSDRVFRMGRRYGVTLICLGITHLVLIGLFKQHIFLVAYYAFMAGMQNAMFIYYNGILIRTTHFTGYLTDIAFEIGRICRGQRDGIWKIRMYSCSILCFILGGALSGMASLTFKHYTMLLVGVFYVVAGLYYVRFRHDFFSK